MEGGAGWAGGAQEPCPAILSSSIEPRKDPERGRKTPVSPGQSSLELTAVGAPCQGHWAEVPLQFFRYHRKMRTSLWGISLEPHREGALHLPKVDTIVLNMNREDPHPPEWKGLTSRTGPLLLSPRRQLAGLAGCSLSLNYFDRVLKRTG